MEAREKIMWYVGIVAMNREGIIGVTGRDGKQRIPWLSDTRPPVREDRQPAFGATPKDISAVVREDMRHFRKITAGNIVIMGRKTFESLPNGPLPNRIHVVLTRRTISPEIPNVYFTSLEKVDTTIYDILLTYPNKKVFVCGGEEIYRALLPSCDRLYITEIPYAIDLTEGETVTRFVPKEEWAYIFQRTRKDENGNQVFNLYFRKGFDFATLLNT